MRTAERENSLWPPFSEFKKEIATLLFTLVSCLFGFHIGNRHYCVLIGRIIIFTYSRIISATRLLLSWAFLWRIDLVMKNTSYSKMSTVGFCTAAQTTAVTVSVEHNNKQQNLQSSDCSSADTPAVCRCLWRW